MRALALLVCLAGCAAPDLLSRVAADCRSGNEDACGALASTASTPSRALVEQDVAAILDGMQRARLYR